jgi:ligand-binding sensor domain-containing protein/signal transduction histidine kinase
MSQFRFQSVTLKVAVNAILIMFSNSGRVLDQVIAYRAWLVTILFLLIPTQNALALDPAKSLSQLKYKSWQTRDGFPQNYVRSIAQTREGYIWLSTESGLVRFDGVRFTTLENSALGRYGAGALYVSRNGSLWIAGSTSKYFRMRDEKFETFRVSDLEYKDPLAPIVEDKDGTLYIGSLVGLFVVKNNKVSQFTERDGLPDKSVKSIYISEDGTIWIGTKRGLCQLLNGRFTTLNALRNEWITAIVKDQAGNLWLGTQGNTLYRYNGVDYTPYKLPNSQVNITSLFVDRHGMLWVGTDASGLLRFENGQFTSPERYVLPDTDVRSIFEDSEGNLWLGTRRGGVMKITDPKFVTYSMEEGMEDDYVHSVLRDERGVVWAGSRKGISVFENGKVRNITPLKGIKNVAVKAIYKDRRGNLWVGTNGAGIIKYRDGKFETLAQNNIRDVNSITEDREGRLWIGTATEGIKLFTDGTVTTIDTDNGLPGPDVRVVVASGNGDVWIGTSGGLARYSKGSLNSYTVREGLSNNSVRSLHLSTDGVLWIGTNEGGLNRLKNGKISYCTRKNGLSDDGIYQIMEDNKGSLWLGSRIGVFRISIEELDRFFNGKLNLIHSVLYDTADGMKDSECMMNGRFVSLDGGKELIFPTIKGIVIVSPERISINAKAPNVLIENVIVDGRPLLPAEKIIIPPSRGDLKVEFTALSFIEPEKVRFLYQLEGFDTQWNEARNPRMAQYTNLPPGAYKFRVMASNNDGIWNESGRSVDLDFQPHFYQTSYFYILCILLLLGLLALGYRIRIRQASAHYSAIIAERTRMAREIHDTLAQGVAGIASQLDLVDRLYGFRPDKAKEHLDIARNLTKYSLTEARRSISELRSGTLEQAGLENALVTVANQAVAASQVKVELQVDGNIRRLPIEVEHNLLRIGQEAIVNAVKHSKATRLKVDLSFEQKSVQLNVKDDGCGFNSRTAFSPVDGHFGLLGMRERAKQIGAQLTVNSNPGEGTELLVRVPVN